MSITDQYKQFEITADDHCNYCGSADTEHLQARPVADGNAGYVKREVACYNCLIGDAEIEAHNNADAASTEAKEPKVTDYYGSMVPNVDTPNAG